MRTTNATWRLTVFTLGVATAWTWQAHAQAPDAAGPSVTADNPGFTNVTAPAPVLVLVTEQSVAVGLSDDNTTLAFPGVLARLGLSSALELRALLPSAVVQLPDAGDTRVDADGISLGALLAGALCDDLGASLAPTLSLPLFDRSAGPAGVDGALQANLSWSATSWLGVDLGLLGGWVHVPGAAGLTPRARVLGGALVSFAPAATGSLYAESYVDCVVDADCQAVVGGGGALWLDPSVQVHLATSLVLESPVVSTVTLGSVIRWW